jgi:site-specific DNA-methyltransferase (adenine-specific)
MTGPYYSDDWCTIYHGDARDLWQQQASVVITDPPYGNDSDYDGYEDTRDNLLALIEGVIKPCVGMYDVVAATSGVANVPLYPDADWMLAWFYPGGPTTGRWGFSTWQPILVWGKDPYHGKGRYPDATNTQRGKPDKLGHPCPKPLSLMRWIVSRVSLEGQTVLDPFMGSGTTLLAAKSTGRKAIGIDQSERYCEIAAERLTQEVLSLGA